MSKQIFTIGYEIPGHNDLTLDFSSKKSLMDTDILLISPNSLYPTGDWISFTTSDGGCYNITASKTYKERVSHLRKEMIDHLNSGKNIFLLLSQEESYSLANNVSTGRKGEHTYSTESYSNYNLLPINIGTLTSASGKKVEFSGNPIFSNFYSKFKKNLEYQLYIENPNEAQVIFTGKDKTKILGAIYKVGTGYLVAFPMVTFNEEDFTEIKKDDDGEEKEFWNKKGVAFGNNFIQCLLEIDSKLTSESEKTPAPAWISQGQFLGKEEKILYDSLYKNNEKIAKIEKENEELKVKLEKELVIKDLLFEQGKPLENTVIRALRILGYQAENYNDGELELDQVIVSPEKYRFIGECEGKDNKDINITKFRQLLESLNADFAREEIEEKAFGILFGNPERLKEPNKRTLDFTKKCKIGAEREKIALVKTTDLFVIVKYLKENKNSEYKKACRKAIYDGLGNVVQFPTLPKKK